LFLLLGSENLAQRGISLFLEARQLLLLLVGQFQIILEKQRQDLAGGGDASESSGAKTARRAFRRLAGRLGCGQTDQEQPEYQSKSEFPEIHHYSSFVRIHTNCDRLSLILVFLNHGATARQITVSGCATHA
jgi:hypothetical protein